MTVRSKKIENWYDGSVSAGVSGSEDRPFSTRTAPRDTKRLSRFPICRRPCRLNLLQAQLGQPNRRRAFNSFAGPICVECRCRSRRRWRNICFSRGCRTMARFCRLCSCWRLLDAFCGRPKLRKNQGEGSNSCRKRKGAHNGKSEPGVAHLPIHLFFLIDQHIFPVATG